MINYIVDQNGEKHVIQIRGTGLWLGDLYSFFQVQQQDLIFNPTKLLNC